MKTYLWLVLIALAVIKSGDSSSLSKTFHNVMNERDTSGNEQDSLEMRRKRDLAQFALMVTCEVKSPSTAVLTDYGCYCGLGGKGTPVDEIDECCYIHDKCYDDITNNKICGPDTNAVYFVRYKRDGCSGCRRYSSRWFIDGKNSPCMKKLCECDGAAARCFKRHFSKFQNRYKKYDKSKC